MGLNKEIEKWNKEIRDEFGKEIYESTISIIGFLAQHDDTELTEEAIWEIARVLSEVLKSQKEEVNEVMITEIKKYQCGKHKRLLKIIENL